MAKQNYGFEKRQKELARKQKKEEKRLRKLERAAEQPDGLDTDGPSADDTVEGTED